MAKYPKRPIGSGAAVFSGFAFKSSDFASVGIPITKIANVQRRTVTLESCDYFPESLVTEKHTKFFLRDGDILIAMTGQGSVGRVGRIRLKKDQKVLVNQRVGKFETDASKLDVRFLFYVISSPEYEDILFHAGYGSGQPNLSPDVICSIEIPMPPLTEQHAITQVLGALDDKIELNQRMNETLEALAQNLFKSLFLEDTETGLPNNWEERGLDEIASFLNGLALQKYPPNGNDSLPVIKIAQLRAGHTEGADRAGTNVPPQYIIEDGDVLFSWSGSLEVEIWCGGRGALNQHLFKVTSANFPKWFYYLWTRHHLLSFQNTAADKATTMGHIQRHHLSEAKVFVPPPTLMQTMNIQFAPLIDKLIANRIESRTLAELRDVLLPKLLSGELRAPGGKLAEARP